MAAQIDHLVELRKQPNVDLVVMPEASDGYLGPIRPFARLHFDADQDPDLLFYEDGPADVTPQEAKADACRVSFDDMRQRGTAGDDLAGPLRTRRDVYADVPEPGFGAS